MNSPIAIAIDKVGSQSALAKAVGVQPALVWQWVSGRRPVAAHHCLTIESKTGVSRHELRPDVFGASAPKSRRKRSP
ncbi:helix-turn-helix domain-containing protein [Stenotrophomonas maltophilia]|uniref:helix-turn-helix domain-containing protein n=1 Tax=Stenotrophomonas maltophilia TaxID=40324 RepID=UPI0009B14620|nr:helix-turn-helix domain-containing protein [Stenotrophomonas maltophilia]